MDIKKIQKEIYQNKVNKGFNVTNIHQEFCAIYGEVGEAYESWRKKDGHVGEELADVVIYIMGLSEILGVDLENEIINKIAINKKREYETIDGVLMRK